MSSIDLNCDLGEGFGRWALGDDEGLLDVVTSANVACGFHAGDPAGLARVCAGAVQRGVVIGAQVGYRDLAGFGRRFIDIGYDDLRADVTYQIGALQALARAAGGVVRYVKPHGALYHATNSHDRQAAAVVDAVRALDPGLALLGFPGSLLLEAGDEAGLRCVTEGFADRRYGDEGLLVPRQQPGAVLTDQGQVTTQAVGLVGSVESICLHGDTDGAVALARAVRTALEQGSRVEPFCGNGS
ncbi:LamB/YcsF family protein [Angustibacter sp. McL0619]|uniref:LamB/YcsF family protein n=1 Tax=Angustibacter sp. McL0619 TaxID=3415676 RepID=UPI003CE7289D